MLHIQTFLKYCTNKTKSTVQWRAQKFFEGEGLNRQSPPPTPVWGEVGWVGGWG